MGSIPAPEDPPADDEATARAGPGAARPAPPSQRAEAAFADFIARHEQAGDAEFEAWVVQRPDLRRELRTLWTRWARLREVLGGIGLHRTVDAPARVRAREERQLADELLRRMARSKRDPARYRRREELGRGGMARVYRVYDEELDRDLAMKVLHGPASGTPVSGTPVSGTPVSGTPASAACAGHDPCPSSRALSRFLDEAEITAKLDHPGITSVHELGIDDKGRAFFTMQLVRGLRLDQLFERRREREAPWAEPEMLEVLLKVCDAVSYAHAKGVVHRDLKPANIMVGRFGETYVIDWGLAHVVERGEDTSGTKVLQTSRSRVSGEDPLSPLMTSDGDILGTPAYMSPEQATGRSRGGGPQSDIYSLGAILYELLAGSAPYMEGSASLTTQRLLERIAKGAPRDLGRLARQVRPELRSICAKAMQRDPRERYRGVHELAADLRSYLQGQPVSTYRPSWRDRSLAWLRENRIPLAFLVLLVAGLGIGLWQETKRRSDLLTLAEIGLLRELRDRSSRLWPPTPEHIPELELALGEARELARRAGSHKGTLAELRRRALPLEPQELARDREQHSRYEELSGLQSQLAVLEAGLEHLAAEANVSGDQSGSLQERRERLRARIEVLDALVGERQSYRFEDRIDQLTHDTLAELEHEYARFRDPDPNVGVISSLERRLRLARAVEELGSSDPGSRWGRAISEVADSPVYLGLSLEPQPGLVPLGPNPHSGLQEFAHSWSGEVPRRASDGHLLLEDSSAIVLVLVPASQTTIGASEETEPLRRSERNARTLALSPFFLAKHELTQAQWLRLCGTNESQYFSGYEVHGLHRITGMHPVENISQRRATEVLARWDLSLPTEAQWECAARAGTQGLRWTGESLEDLSWKENVADRTGAAYLVHLESLAGPLPSEDGWILHAPVASLAPNPFGFHDMLGNVSEWCRDVFMVSHDWPMRAGDGLRLHPEPSREFVIRGGNYYSHGSSSRVTFRQARLEDKSSGTVGLRPARALRSERQPRVANR